MVTAVWVPGGPWGLEPPFRPLTDLWLAFLLVRGRAQVGVLCRPQVGLTLGKMTWQSTQAGCPPLGLQFGALPHPNLRHPQKKSLHVLHPAVQAPPLLGDAPYVRPLVVRTSESLAEEQWCLAHSADEETEAASRRETRASCAPPGGPRRAVPSAWDPRPHFSCRSLWFSGTLLTSPTGPPPISSETSTHVASYAF